MRKKIIVVFSLFILYLILLSGKITYAQIEYKVTIMTTGGGTTIPIPGNYTYTTGDVINITAIPLPFYKFDCWTINNVITEKANPLMTLADSDKTIVAHFSFNLSSPLEIIIMIGKTVESFIGVQGIPLTLGFATILVIIWLAPWILPIILSSRRRYY